MSTGEQAMLDVIFRTARTYFAWQPKPVPEALLRQAYEIAKFGPTTSNSCPMRMVFVATKEGKERLRRALVPGNVDKTMSAPVTAIFGYDTKFYEHFPKLFPHNAEPKRFFEEKLDIAARAAFRNGTLQGAYFLMAARAVGLDCGPMSGFNHDILDAEYFPDGRIKSNFLMNIGYGDPAPLFPRGPRFEFDEVCQFA